MSEQGSNWDKVDKVLERSHPDASGPLPSLVPEVQHYKENRPAKPEGLIAQYKASKIGRKIALEKLTEWHEAELQVVKTQLAEAVRVKKAEAYFHAEQQLTALETRHRSHLIELKIRNDSVQNQGAERLLTELTESLRRLQEGDFPEALRAQTIRTLVDNYLKSLARFFRDPAD